jgi:hypothetical protein
MSTTELPLGTYQAAKSSAFIFDVTLSTAIAAHGKMEAHPLVPKGPISPGMLDKMNRYWRAANYLCIVKISPQKASHCLLKSLTVAFRQDSKAVIQLLTGELRIIKNWT